VKSLIFDTETTGLVDFGKKPDHPSQPHVVQLGMEVTDDAKREVLMSINLLVRAEKRSHPKALEVHGKDEELLNLLGVSPKTAAQLFLELTSKVDRLVAHNYDFDKRMMQSECARLNLEYPIGKTSYCTMKDSGRSGTHAGRKKWPKLIEIYKEMVNPKGFEGAHDALVDVRACREVLWALIDEQDGKPTREEQIKEVFKDETDSNESRPYKVDEFLRETDAAWYLSIKKEEHWLPKSQCKFDKDDLIVMIPNWLAQKKGLYEG